MTSSEAATSEQDAQHGQQPDRLLQPTPPSGASKKRLALWKKELKNLKTKDAGKKLEGLRYCARDERFVREQSEVLPVMIGFLSRVKMPEVIAETLKSFKILLTVSERPASATLTSGETQSEVELPVQQLHPEDNRQFVVETACATGDAAAWKAGDPFVAVFTAAVAPEIKIQAIEVFSILLRHCIHMASSTGNTDCLHAFQTTASPAIALLACLDVDHAELQLTALQCISLLFGNPPDDSFFTSFQSSDGLQKLLVFMQRPERRFHRPVLEIIESFSFHENGRAYLRSSGVADTFQLMVSATVETTETTIATATATPPMPITLSADEAALMHGNVSIACRILARMLCAKETITSSHASLDFTDEVKSMPATIDSLLAILQRDISSVVSPPPPPAAPTGNNAAAQAAAAAAIATATSLAALFPFSSTKCADILTCLGRLIESNQAVKSYAKTKGLLPILVQVYRIPGESALHQSVDKLLHLCATTEALSGEALHLCEELKKEIDPQIFSTVQASTADSEEPVEKGALLTVDSLLSILDSCLGAVAAEGEDHSATRGVVFRLIRWLSIVVDSSANAKALGEPALSVLVKILLETKPTETVLCGFLCKTVQAISQQSPEACELCSTDARNPVTALVTFLHSAYPGVDPMVPHRAVSVASEIETTLSAMENEKSDETVVAEEQALVQFKLEWLSEWEEPDVFDPHSLTQLCHEAVDPFLYAARALEVFASSFTRVSEATTSSTNSGLDFAELLTQRLETAGKNQASNSNAAAAKKKAGEATNAAAKSLSGEAIVVCVLEKALEIFKLLGVFSSKNAEVAVSLLTTITTLSRLPGGVRALLALAKTAMVVDVVPVETASEATENEEASSVTRETAVPPTWPWTREQAQVTEHAWLLAPILAVFETPVTCFYQLEAATTALAAITADYEPEPTPQGGVPPANGATITAVEIAIHESDRFVNAALSRGALVYLVAVLDNERVPLCPKEHHRRQTFTQAAVTLALRFIETGSLKQSHAIARRQELLDLHEQLTTAAAAAAASAPPSKTAKQEHTGPMIDITSLQSQKIEYKTTWASELLDAPFDLRRFGYQRVPALLLATQIGHHEIATALLAAGVAPDATSSLDATTPLMLALLTRNKPLALALLQAGASVDAITQDGLDVSVWACALASPIRDDLASLISRVHSATIGHKQVIQLDALIELDSEDGSPDMELLEAMLTRGLDVNVSNAQGDFMLHALLSKCVVRKQMRGLDMCFRYNSMRSVAASAGDDNELLRVVTLLVNQHRAQLDACNRLGQTPLHVALLYGHAHVALLLLQRGANPNVVDAFGLLPLHYACLGFYRDEAQAVETLEALLAAAAKHELVQGVHVDRRKHKTATERAAVDVEALLDNGFADVSAPPAIARTLATVEQVLTTRSQSPDGFLPWHLTCGATCHLNTSTLCLSDEMNTQFLANGTVRAALLAYLITKHPCISMDDRTTTKQLTGLHLAVKTDVDGSNAPVIEVLLAQPSLPSYLNAVHEPTTIDALVPIEEGSLVELTTDDLLYVPHAHVSTRSLQHKYHVILPDGTHLENLHRHQLKVSSTSTVSALASRYTLRLESGFSALHYALQASDAVATTLLQQPGISLQPEGSDLPLLTLACAARRSAAVVARLVNQQVNVRVYLPLHDGSSHEQGSSHSDTTSSSGGSSGGGGAASRAASRKQAAALHFAVMYEDVALVRALVTRKDHTNVNVRRSGDGFTPLHIACGMGNMEIIKLLLEFGANFIQMSTVSSNSSGITPLHLLIKEDGVENEKLRELIAHGYITREMLLEGLGAPAVVSAAKSSKQDEPRGAANTSPVNGRATPEARVDLHHVEDESEDEMEISCVLLDEEEHNLSLYNHVQQLLETKRGATGFCLRLQSELTKSDDVLLQFFGLLRGVPSPCTPTSSSLADPSKPRRRSSVRRSSSLALVTEEELIEGAETPREGAVALVASESSSSISADEQASLQTTRHQFAQLKHWHECYAQQTVRSQWENGALSVGKMMRRSSFDRRSTRQLLADTGTGTENDAGTAKS